MTLSLAFLIGFLTGLRSLAPSAIAAWAAYLGWLKLQGTLAPMGSVYAAGTLSALALGELAADKWWARIPDRTTAMPLAARILMGALTGACVAAAGGEAAMIGAALGAVGGVAGAFGGFHARRRMVQAFGGRDFPIALLEDLVVIVGGLWIVTRFV